ncbi:MAG: nickel-dependent lactate racemase [Chloroflexi bacterium]|nr:nickel-dependent lactate racemase [Chloroflexota bacterium]
MRSSAAHHEIVVPYGHESRVLRVPADNIIWVVGPGNAEPVPDLPAAVQAAIRSPIAAPTLPELARRHGTQTVLLIDDNTRSTPQARILPVVLDELNAAGVPDSDISALIALGTHRPMCEAECVEHFGQEVMDRIRVENLPQSPADFVDLGTTPLGIPVQVSRRYLESDLSIAVGNIIPHMYAGWAGGAKMVQPGVTSALTTARTHLMAGPCVYDILGKIDNPVRREMEDIAARSGLKFIVNVVLNGDHEVVAVVAGDAVAAHREGVRIAEPIYTVTIDQKPDIVVASSYPADRDLWQGVKPLNNCGMMVRDGGTLILLHPAPEGIAPDHPGMVELGRTPADLVCELALRDELSDGVGAATYVALDQTRRRVHVVLVSIGISAAEADRIGLQAATSFEDALDQALARHGEQATIGVVTRGGDIVARMA